jgi:mono/diheme cytochrome c family protein
MMFGMPAVVNLDSAGWLASDEATNGELIFQTGFNIDGQRITFESDLPWLYMHGGGCASCHGVDGTGGRWVMMTALEAPDIRYASLTEPEHTDEHPPYDDALVAQAVRDGLDPAGNRLDPAMPRWNLSDRDLADVIEYLKALDGTTDAH